MDTITPKTRPDRDDGQGQPHHPGRDGGGGGQPYHCSRSGFEHSGQTGAKVIDASGKIVMPGMISCHNHLYSAVVRSIPYSGFKSPDFSFVSWMDRFWLPLLEDRVDQSIMYAGTRANVADHIRSGITTTTDTAEGSYALPGALEAVDKACMETGIRAVLSFETTGRISEENAAMGLAENINHIKRCRSRVLRPHHRPHRGSHNLHLPD